MLSTSLTPSKKKELLALHKLVNYYILVSTTIAGSGHPTSSLSPSLIMTILFFGGFFKADLEDVNNQNNDRLIFSKGHACPLLYALYTTAGKLSFTELKTLRKFGSNIEGHPSMDFKYTEAPTGSLGQGLGIGLGMALASEMDNLNYKTYVLMGDSELAEGSVWEAIMLAGYRQTKNLIGIIDMNRLGQRGQTMLGHDLEKLQSQITSFGWQVLVIDNGQDADQIYSVFYQALELDKPVMIIAKTYKGAGISFLEDKDGWHGKALSQNELNQALFELGSVDLNLIGVVNKI